MIDWRWVQAFPGLFGAGAANALLFYPRFLRVRVVEPVPGLQVLLGGGANVAVLAAKGEALLVDAKFPPQDARVAGFVRARGLRVDTLINTHHHYDHTHGNIRFPGALILAHARAVDRLDEVDRRFWGEPGNGTAKPKPFPGDSSRLEFRGEPIHLLHLGPAHTDGDIVVHLPERGVVCTGDLVFNEHFPFVDHAAGGSFIAWRGALTRMLQIDAELFIPGHGPVATRGDVERFHGYLRDLTEAVRDAIRAGAAGRDVLRRVDLGELAGRRPIPSFSLVPDELSRRLQWANLRRNVLWAAEEIQSEPLSVPES